MQQQPQRSISPIEGLVVVGLVFWLFFMGGISVLKSSKVAPTIGTGVQRLVGTAAAIATERPVSLTAPISAVATGNRSAGRDVKLPPPARGAGAGTTSNTPAQTAATSLPTAAAPAATPTLLIAGGEPAAGAAAPAALGYAVPVGEHTDINPDGSFTVNHGNIRYYVDTNSNVVDVRLVGYDEPAVTGDGAPPEQKVFLDPANPTDAAYLAETVPTATPSNVKVCGGRSRSCK